jgi:hypothetical protein
MRPPVRSGCPRSRRRRAAASGGGAPWYSRRRVGHGKLDDGPALSTADEQASLVGRDRYEPGAEPSGVAQATDLPPDDRPGSLDRFVGDVEVAADHEADLGHVVVEGLDDPRECNFVAACSQGHRTDELVLRLDRHGSHTPQMLGGGSNDSGYPTVMPQRGSAPGSRQHLDRIESRAGGDSDSDQLLRPLRGANHAGLASHGASSTDCSGMGAP